MPAPGEIFRLSGRVPPGERVVAVAVDEIQSLGYQLAPGDRVDLYFLARRGTVLSIVPLLQNVPVLGTGRALGGETPPPQYRYLLLSLTPREAQLVLLAQRMGTLYYLLRNPQDVETVTLPLVNEFEVMGEKLREEVQKKRQRREKRIRIFKGRG